MWTSLNTGIGGRFMDVAAAADTGSITPSSMAISEGIYLSYAKLGALEMLGTLRVLIW